MTDADLWWICLLFFATAWVGWTAHLHNSDQVPTDVFPLAAPFVAIGRWLDRQYLDWFVASVITTIDRNPCNCWRRSGAKLYTEPHWHVAGGWISDNGLTLTKYICIDSDPYIGGSHGW
jgi:hypothetical protein